MWLEQTEHRLTNDSDAASHIVNSGDNFEDCPPIHQPQRAHLLTHLLRVRRRFNLVADTGSNALVVRSCVCDQMKGCNAQAKRSAESYS
eukprot:96020-Amphidinium_carterae.1